MKDFNLKDKVYVDTLYAPEQKGVIVSKRTLKTYYGFITNYDVLLEDNQIKLIELLGFSFSKQ